VAALDRAEGRVKNVSDVDYRVGVTSWFGVGDDFAEGGDS
jgi:hypothetical protein